MTFDHLELKGENSHKKKSPKKFSNSNKKILRKNILKGEFSIKNFFDKKNWSLFVSFKKEAMLCSFSMN